MTDANGLTLTTVTLSSPDPRALAAFYRRLLGWDIGADEPGWVTLRDPAGALSLGFHVDERYERPTWPSARGSQQMMMHLEIRVEDLDRASEHAQACGATLAAFQPQEDVRVHLDPDGHPFCLWI